MHATVITYVCESSQKVALQMLAFPINWGPISYGADSKFMTSHLVVDTKLVVGSFFTLFAYHEDDLAWQGLVHAILVPMTRMYCIGIPQRNSIIACTAVSNGKAGVGPSAILKFEDDLLLTPSVQCPELQNRSHFPQYWSSCLSHRKRTGSFVTRVQSTVFTASR